MKLINIVIRVETRADSARDNYSLSFGIDTQEPDFHLLIELLTGLSLQTVCYLFSSKVDRSICHFGRSRPKLERGSTL